MFSHMMVGSNDVARSKRFYDALFGAIGGKPAVEDEKGRLLYLHNGGVFIVTPPIDGEPATHASLRGGRVPPEIELRRRRLRRIDILVGHEADVRGLDAQPRFPSFFTRLGERGTAVRADRRREQDRARYAPGNAAQEPDCDHPAIL